MYHVIGTISVLTVLYLLSVLFYRSGLYTRQFHRKIWNFVLAASFILTAAAGLFLALHVNKKWDIPFIEIILKWHVEIGTGMAFSGLMHLLWHFSYYTGIFKSSPGEESTGSGIEQVKNISLNLFITGFVSSSVQLLLLREIMNITGGYELISGIFLGSWLLASSAGSFIAGRSALNNQKKLNTIFSLSPLISVTMLILLQRLFMETGQSPSFLASFIFTLIVLAPFCIISGFIFVKLLSLAVISGKYQPGKSFSIETAGGVLSGIVVTALTAGILNTYQILFLIITLYITWVILSFNSPDFGIPVKVFAFLVTVVVIVTNIDVYFRQLLLPGAKINETIDTPYGNVTYGEYGNEKSLFYNHRLISYAEDVIEREENIHYAMLQADDPERVILISGQLSSHLGEILKYSPSGIVYVERDPLLALVNVPDSIKEMVDIKTTDALSFIRRNIDKADVIISLIPPPSTLQMNRYFTSGFFSLVKRNLNEGGIFMCSTGPSEAYFNPESLALYSSVYNSLKISFKNVLPISGNKLYLIASDKELSSSVCRMTGEKGIRNVYVGCDYLYDDIIQARSGEIIKMRDTASRINTMDYPVAALSYQHYVFSRDSNEKTISYALILFLFATPALTIKRKNILMYTGAAALSGFEIIIILMIQSVAGSMYQLTGLILAGMMGGLAIGASNGHKLLKDFGLSGQVLIILVFYTVFAIFSNQFLETKEVMLTVSLLVLICGIPAFITGDLFSKLTLSGKEENISAVYSADLAGSAMGFVLISGVSIPAIGIRNSLFLICFIVISGLIFGSDKFSKQI